MTDDVEPEKRKIFACSNRFFTLRNEKTNEILEETCICGSIFCFVPALILNRSSDNQFQLFLEFKED